MKVIINKNLKTYQYDNVMQVSINYDEAIPDLLMDSSLIVSIIYMLNNKKELVRFNNNESFILNIIDDKKEVSK